MKSVEITAKNVQKAIEQGLKELNATQDEVDIKILDEGGFFRKAKVLLTLEKEVEEEPKQEEKTEVKDTAKKESPKKEKQEKFKEEKKAKKEKTVEAKEPKQEEKKADDGDLETFGTKFLSDLCEKMGIQAEISYLRTEDGIVFNASGEKVNNLIGKRGETLNAIQEILSCVCKNSGFREERVFFDVENYKNRREISLIGLAERMANKAKKYKKPIKLESMSAYERKIIHNAISQIEGVSSKSEGEEPNRRLVIIPTKKED